MSTPKKPRKRGFILQGRDLDLLRGLFEYRVMTAAHVAALDGREEAKTRLKILKATGLVRAEAVRGRQACHRPRWDRAAAVGGVLTEYPPLVLEARGGKRPDPRARIGRDGCEGRVPSGGAGPIGGLHRGTRAVAETVSVRAGGRWPRVTRVVARRRPKAWAKR